MRRKWWIGLAALLLLSGLFVLRHGFDWPGSPWARGTTIEALNGVPVYDNGPVPALSHGASDGPGGYSFGRKWLSDEFVKRYLFRARGHRMPDGGGSAASLFDIDTPQGALNERRGLLQYRQDGSDAPATGDVIVFEDEARLGHAAIIAAVGPDFVEVVQQNAAPARERLALNPSDGRYHIGGSRPVLGWLRVPTMQAMPVVRTGTSG
jgi:hypothetical protein